MSKYIATVNEGGKNNQLRCFMYTELVYINDDHPSLIRGSATYTLLFKLKPS